MDFNLTQEQAQFSDAVRRWIDKAYGFEARQAIIASENGWSQDIWQQLSDLGLMALSVPESCGGLGGSVVDLMVAVQALGHGLVVEPYLATVIGASCLDEQRHAAILESVAGGQVRLACALGERQSRYECNNVKTWAAQENDAFRIDGEKTVVVHAAQANYLIVSARVSGGQRDTAGLGLFLVPVDLPGVTVREYRTIDGQRAADVVFDRVLLPPDAAIGRPGEAWASIERLTDLGASLLCAEAVGAMDKLHGLTLDYLKTRQQFGVPLGKFQVLQHRMADMFMQLELARSMSMLAAARMDEGDAHERRKAVSAAKNKVGRAMRYVGQQAVQLHGGMGVTNELPAAHYFKRLTMIEVAFGDTDHHLQRFVDVTNASMEDA